MHVKKLDYSSNILERKTLRINTESPQKHDWIMHVQSFAEWIK